MKRRIADTWLTVLTGLCLVVLAVSAVHGGRLWPDFDELGGVAVSWFSRNGRVSAPR